MATMFGNAIAGGVDRLVRWVIVPVTSVIPFLVRTRLLVLAFAAIWLAVLAGLVAQPEAIDSAWASIGDQPLPLLAVLWLLFLPVMAGLWIWATDWPLIVRAALLLGLAAWNLLVFLPRREAGSSTAD